MKQIIFTALALTFSLALSAQESISLLAPDKNVNVTLTDALQNRHSDRNFSKKAISNETLSLIL